MGVTSTVGQGSTFWLELCQADGHRPEFHLDEIVEPHNFALSGPKSVLYIEDNLANLRLVEQLIQRRPGVELFVAMQGGIGLELARQQHPDLILLDANLPDLAGIDVLRRLKADDATNAIPVVVLSADATPGQIERLRMAGASDYLTKPLDVRLFLRMLDGALVEPQNLEPAT
jgi:CheY-like chemotaxis protein